MQARNIVNLDRRSNLVLGKLITEKPVGSFLSRIRVLFRSIRTKGIDPALNIGGALPSCDTIIQGGALFVIVGRHPEAHPVLRLAAGRLQDDRVPVEPCIFSEGRRVENAVAIALSFAAFANTSAAWAADDIASPISDVWCPASIAASMPMRLPKVPPDEACGTMDVFCGRGTIGIRQAPDVPPMFCKPSQFRTSPAKGDMG